METFRPLVWILTLVLILDVFMYTEASSTFNRIPSAYITTETIFDDLDAAVGVPYSYDPSSDYGPHNWKNKYRNFCNEEVYEKQSPININPSIAETEDYRLSYIGGIDGIISGKQTNNGHTAKFNVDESATKLLKGVPNDDEDKYQIHQWHFHMGKIVYNGSEHTFDNKYFPSEVHIVHYNAKYDTFEAALVVGRVAVVAVFVELFGFPDVCPWYDDLCRREKNILNYFETIWKPACHPDDKAPGCPMKSTAMAGYLCEVKNRYSGLSRYIMDYVCQVTNPGEVPASINLKYLIPSTEKFYTYKGGMTTPLCEPNVQMIALTSTVKISLTAAYVLHILKDSDGIPYSKFSNCRPIMPLNDREIKKNF